MKKEMGWEKKDGKDEDSHVNVIYYLGKKVFFGNLEYYSFDGK